MKTIAKLDLKTYNEEKKQFEMCVDARTLMTFERIYRLETKNGKATFINSLPLLQEGDMQFLICLMASALRFPNEKRPVGLEYVFDELPVLENIQTVMEGVAKCLEDLKIEPDGNDKGKSKKMTK